MFYPLKFEPILVERVWGGDALSRYGKPIAPGQKIGETWEISDRDEAQSRIANGAYHGQTLRGLIHTLGSDRVVGAPYRARPDARFPLLIKLLDARETLSLQVHPPATIAGKLDGEPKTEMWHILEAPPNGELFAGLRRGVTRRRFEQALASARLADLIHRVPVRAGESLFIPSGRVHAIGAGLILVEIQQNSDTTYRVYDWGRGRQLHLEESLASIDFTDIEPSPSPLPLTCDYFTVERLALDRNHRDRCDGSTFHVYCCLGGRLAIGKETLERGEFVLLPAALGEYSLKPLAENTVALKTCLPKKTGHGKPCPA